MVLRVDVDAETRAPTGKTAAYVVGEGPGLVVDPPARTDELDDAIAARDVQHVAVTHHHPDHVGAVRTYAREFDLTVWARAGRTHAFTTATGVEPDRTFGPTATLPAGEGIRVLDTPGHAPEHTAFVTPEGIVTGDLAVAEGSVVVGAPDGDMRAYVTSLRRVHARNPDRLFPGHGPTIDSPRRACERLLAHRLDRERRILAAVRNGARSVSGIIERAYDKDLTGLRDLARATVEAHLEKLAVENAISWDGDTAVPT